jgi:hypothetical protein
MSLAAGGGGGEGEAMIEVVHRFVVVFEGRLADAFVATSLGVILAHHAAADDA